MGLDKTDALVLSSLRRNAREKLTAISKRVQLPVSTIYDRMKSLNNTLIKKRTVLLDFPKLGYNTRVMFVLKVDRAQRDDVKRFLAKQESINNLYKINNGFDFFAEMVFKHVKDMEDFSEELENKFKILHKDIYYVIDEIERECFMNRDFMLKNNEASK